MDSLMNTMLQQLAGTVGGARPEQLAQVARHKQVLCVTHLPQIAAMADVHFSVEKGEKAGRTYTAVEALDREMIRRNLSPGGCADLLAVTYFLHAVTDG